MPHPLQLWRSPHPPKRGTFWLGTQPLVHSGFLSSWNRHGLDAQVLQRVRAVLEGAAHSSAEMAPLPTTVARCCSPEHEVKGAELAAAAALAREAEAAQLAETEECEDEPSGSLAAEEAALSAAVAIVLGHSGAAARAGSGSSSRTANLVSADPSNRSGGKGGSVGGGGSSKGGSGSGQPPFFRILVCGHSLGGAVGQLCSFDLSRQLLQWGFRIAPPGVPDAPAADAGHGAGGGLGREQRPISLQCYR